MNKIIILDKKIFNNLINNFNNLINNYLII